MNTPATLPGDALPDPARCPLCGRPNDCQVCTTATYKGSCWCAEMTFPEELYDRIPADARNRACVCRPCILAALKARPLPPLAAGDFYLEPGTGRMVFTAAYLRKRGYCCGSGCRHCPWAATRDAAKERAKRNPPGGLALLLAVLGLATFASHQIAAAQWTEDFATNPLARGWHVTGDTNRFTWNATEQRVDVTWDTASPHSFWAYPLPQSLTAADAFTLAWDLQLNDAEGGVREGRPGAMQVAVGLLNFERATSQNYARGAGRAYETLEFNWFPAGFIPGFGAIEPTLSAIAFDQTGRVVANFDFPFEFPLGLPQRLELTHEPEPRAVTLRVRQAGTLLNEVRLPLPASFGNFDLDAVAVLVWDERTSQADSLRAHGWVDNFSLTFPDPPIRDLTLLPSGRDVEFLSSLGWNYTLEACATLGNWSTLGDPVAGTGERLRLGDLRDADFPAQFYRVNAQRP